MIENRKIFDDLQQDWELIQAEPFEAKKVESFRERVVNSRRIAWVDGNRNDDLYSIYRQLGAGILDFLIANEFDDLRHLYDRIRWFGGMKDGNRVRIVKYILESNPSQELLQHMLYMSAYETEALAIEGFEKLLDFGVDDYQLRWVLEQQGYTGLRRPSDEYRNTLLMRVSKTLMDRSPTRADLLNIIRFVPSLKDEAWSRLKERGFLLGTLTKLVREFPDEYAEFAWVKILEHDASAERMKKIVKGFRLTEKTRTYVRKAADWLEANSG